MKRRSFLVAVGALAPPWYHADARRNETVSPRASSDGLGGSPGCVDMGDVVNVRTAPYNASGDGVTDDTRAFNAAKAASNTIYVPPGVYRLSHFDGSNVTLRGAGRRITALQGDGDLITNATRFNLEHIAIRNVKIRGKLVSVASGPDARRSKFTDVEFGLATNHVYADRVCVDWSFQDCTFNDASQASRHFKAAWAFKELGCYSWYNFVGLSITGGTTISSFGCVYEYNKSQAVILSATAGGAINNVVFQGTHFESNGNVNHTETVRLETVAAERIRNVAFNNCAFMELKGAHHVVARAGGGGNIARISFRDVFASADLMNVGFVPIFDNVEMNTGSPPMDALVVESLLARVHGSLRAI